MIYNFTYADSFSDRADCLQYLEDQQFKRVIDIGFYINSWSRKYTTHYVDINKSDVENVKGFIGNISTYGIWEEVLDDVKQNGKFDFAICTHTLEDISSPNMVCELLPRIAKEGYIAVPSKYMELVRHEGLGHHAGYIDNRGGYRGWIHHRWIFNKIENDFWGYPKLSFTEYVNDFGLANSSKQDLRFFWKDDFKLNVIGNDFLGPTDIAVREMYKTAFAD